MRYLAICCLLMLAIALAHAIPSQRFYGLSSLAKAKSKRTFGEQDTLNKALAKLKAKPSSRQSLQLRQEGEETEETPSVCEDICEFDSIWLSNDPEKAFDNSIKCTKEAVGKMEHQFAEEYHKETGGEALFSDAVVQIMWTVRMSKIDLESRMAIEDIWSKEAERRFNEAEIQMDQGQVKSYGCLLKKVHDALWLKDCFEDWDCLHYLMSEEEK